MLRWLMRATTRWVVGLWFACFAGAGCTPGGTGPVGARYTFTSEGAGEANTASLDPLRDGTYRGGLLVDGTVDLPAGRARRVIEVGSGEYTYVIDTKVGLFLAGGLIDGVLANPILLVPATVRVGMKWTVAQGDDPNANAFEVTSRVVGPSLFGRNTVQWSIVRTSSKGTTSREYTEGFGISLSGGDILPLDTPDPEPSKAPRVAIARVPGTESIGLPSAATATSISMVRAAGHDALLMFDDDTGEGRGARSAYCLKVSATSAVLQEPSAGSPYRRTGPDVCPTMQRFFTGLDATKKLNVSGHASGAFVATSGRISWIPRYRGNLVSSGLTELTTLNDVMTARALVPGDAGIIDIFYSGPAAGTGVAQLGGAAYLYDAQTEPDIYLPDTWFALPATATFVSALTTDEGDRHTLLIQTADLMLWLSRATSTGMTAPVQVGRLGGTLSVQTTERGSEILRVTSDGRVDRLHVSAGQVTLEPLANLELATRMSVDAAFLFREPAGDRLVVALLELDGIGGGAFTQLFRSTSAIEASAERLPLQPSVSASAAGGAFDQLVCLPPGDQGVDVTDWTVGDEPAGVALEVAPGRRCVLAVRGPRQEVRDPGTSYDTTLGSFPGFGRVVVHSLRWAGRGLAPAVQHVLAPLTGGAVAHPSRRYGRGLVALEPATLTPTPTTGPSYGALWDMWLQVPLVEPRGEGFWALRRAFDPAGVDLVRFGKTFFHHTLVAGEAEPHSVSQLGGLLAMVRRGGTGPYTWVRLTADGAETPLPVPPAGLTYCAQLSDGTLCGDLFEPQVSMRRRIACIPPGGTQRTATVVDAAWGDLQCRGATVLADGSLLLQGGGRIYRLDPATMDWAIYHEGALSLGYGSDGSVWGVTVAAADGAISLYRCEPAGPRLQGLAGDYKVAPSPTYQLVVTDDVIGVIARGPTLVMTRIPRPIP